MDTIDEDTSSKPTSVDEDENGKDEAERMEKGKLSQLSSTWPFFATKPDKNYVLRPQSSATSENVLTPTTNPSGYSVDARKSAPALLSGTSSSWGTQQDNSLSQKEQNELSRNKVLHWQIFPNPQLVVKDGQSNEDEDREEVINDEDQVEQINTSTQASQHDLVNATGSKESNVSGEAQSSIEFLSDVNDDRVGFIKFLEPPTPGDRKYILSKFPFSKNQDETQTDYDPEYYADIKLRPCDIDKLEKLHKERKVSTDSSTGRKSKNRRDNGQSVRTVSASIGYSQYRKEGEAFLDMEFVTDDDDNSEASIHSEIISNAEEIKRLVAEKKMGLPLFYSDSILQMADEIIVHHSNSIYDIFSRRESQETTNDQTTNQLAQNIKNIATESESILNILKSKGKALSGPNDGSGTVDPDAIDHLEKMVKKLHCRHRRMKKLADEIIAKRWKIINMKWMKQKQEKGEPVPVAFQKRGTDHRKGKKEKRRGHKLTEEDFKVLYENPMAKLKTMGNICGDQEKWEDEDPLWKAINKVGVQRFEKCFATNRESAEKVAEDATVKQRKKSAQKPAIAKTLMTEHKLGVFPSTIAPTLEAHFGKSAVTIFMDNYSKMVVIPSRMNLPSPDVARKHIFMKNVDKNEISNSFVEQWKRRSYAIGIFLVLVTALLHCFYLIAPRMGDNYVTYTMSLSISGPSLWWTPTGIYGLIFLGYLFGSMAVIKTAAALEHHQSVKQYVSQRRKKFYLWYGLAFYFFLVWAIRVGLWFARIDTTEQEIRNIFRTNFFYKQLPSRLLYTQYLLGCCGANGPHDYKESDQIGLPKSCYVKVHSYDDYFREPQPFSRGCLTQVYKYNAISMSMVCSLSLIVWLLVLVHPIYLYVYELFLCMKSQVPEPWLEYSKG